MLILLLFGECLCLFGINDGLWFVVFVLCVVGYECGVVIDVLFDVVNGIVFDCDGELFGFVLFCWFGCGYVIGLVIVLDVLCV